jgi:transcriptional regulator with XRE-family HTH domain
VSVTQAASPRSPQKKRDSHIYFAALGKRVLALRKSQGMTQAELGRALGVSQQAVFAYEIGDRRISAPVLERMAKLFKLSVDQLLGLTPEPTRKGRLSPKAIRHAERLQALPKTQQRFVIRIIDVLEEENSAGKETSPRSCLN